MATCLRRLCAFLDYRIPISLHQAYQPWSPLSTANFGISQMNTRQSDYPQDALRHSLFLCEHTQKFPNFPRLSCLSRARSRGAQLALSLPLPNWAACPSGAWSNGSKEPPSSTHQPIYSFSPSPLWPKESASVSLRQCQLVP